MAREHSRSKQESAGKCCMARMSRLDTTGKGFHGIFPAVGRVGDRCGRFYSEQTALWESCHGGELLALFACFHSWRINPREAGILGMLPIPGQICFGERACLPEGLDSARSRMCS